MNVNSEREFEKLEEALFRAGQTVRYPPTPPLAARVREQLAAERTLRGRNWLPRGDRPTRLGLVLAALVLALALLLAFPDVREALAQLLGLRTVRILFVTPTPTPTPTWTPTPQPPGAGGLPLTPTHTETPGQVPSPTASSTPKPFALCCEMTLAEAQQHARFKILLPASESPSRVYFQEILDIPEAQQVVLVFGDANAPRWTLYQATNVVYGKLIFSFGKLVEPGTVLSETTVKGQRALWLAEAPHILVYLDAQGKPVVGTERPVDANTLAWEQGEITFRLETQHRREEAVRFAESLR